VLKAFGVFEYVLIISGGNIKMSVAKIGKRGTLIIPAEIRKKIGLKEGDDVLIEVDEKGTIHMLKRPLNFSQALQNLHAQIWENVDPVQYVKEERASWEK
jgi:AbrB family looped-hinge helix DNA binding protein